MLIVTYVTRIMDIWLSPHIKYALVVSTISPLYSSIFPEIGRMEELLGARNAIKLSPTNLLKRSAILAFVAAGQRGGQVNATALNAPTTLLLIRRLGVQIQLID